MGRYVDVDDLKKYVKSETAYDFDLYTDAIAAAEQYLDDKTGLYIGVAGSPSAGSFRPHGWRSTYLPIVNCSSITSVVENGATLTANVDYVAEPRPRPAGEAKPYLWLRRIGGTYWYFDDYEDTVVVTAAWGFVSLPPGAKTACLVAAKAYLDNRDLKFGIVGAAEFGGITEREAKIVSDFIRVYGRGDHTYGLS